MAVVALTDRGSSAYKFVDPAPPPAKSGGVAVEEVRPTTQVLNARPIMPLARPVYPPAARAAHAGMASVGVHIVVDTTGRVADVRSSLTIVSLPSTFAEEFRSAVDAAVARWQFQPGEIRHLEVVKAEGGDYLRVVSREKVDWAFDVEFTFNEMGGVLTRLPN